MSWVGEATGAVGLLGKGWDWWKGRRDPARRSAQRLIRAFEAHGVARQQIIRPDGHPKLLHCWPVKLLQAGRGDYAGSEVMIRRAAASLSL